MRYSTKENYINYLEKDVMRLFRVSNVLYHTLIVSVINKENKHLSIKLSPDSNHFFGLKKNLS